ncbi:hypothetical protein [Mangrovivirga cuniculi]|uniref:hypothetical protein n=1 Tax=Mangrovivirga cuniculi TaxID=2715131 RepID=UPI001FE4D2ED|nr:hypothetical protein [Mangrovivirga cuniculi]
MNFEYTERTLELQKKLTSFFEEHILPVEGEVNAFLYNPDNRWKPWPGMEDLKEKAKAAGLWNLFLPKAMEI